jgi:hypothetical protein
MNRGEIVPLLRWCDRVERLVLSPAPRRSKFLIAGAAQVYCVGSSPRQRRERVPVGGRPDG